MTTPDLATQILAALRNVVPWNANTPLHEPSFGGNEWRYVKECLDTCWVSSVGKFVDRFEQELASYTGARRAVVVVNGTAALQVCLQLAGVQRYDEVLIPALTFIATANAVSYCGGIPHFVDSEERTLGLDPYKLSSYLDDIAELRADGCHNRKTGRRIKAVVPMHTFGHPVDLDPLVELCGRFQLELIEDAAESIGSYYKGQHTGTIGRISALSFNGNKTITTGGGGAILTNDEALGNLAKHITTTAKIPHRWEFFHDMIGYNFRMPNINAALGCAQLEQLDSFITAKRSLTQVYATALSNISGIRLFMEPEFARSNYWLQAILLDDEYTGERDHLLTLTNNGGIMTRPVWTLLCRLPMFINCPCMNLSVAESLERRVINIPSSATLWGGVHGTA